MYAIVEIGGKQYRVQKDATISVDQIDSKDKENLAIDKVLLYVNGEDILIGQPYLKNVKVSAKIMDVYKGAKVRGVKFKKRKNYTRTVGQRPRYIRLKISDVKVT